MKLRKFCWRGLSTMVLLAGTFSATESYAQQYCREYNQNVTVGGRVQPSYGTACLQPDGSWQIISQQQDNEVYAALPPAVIQQPPVVVVERDAYYPPVHYRQPQPSFQVVIGDRGYYHPKHHHKYHYKQKHRYHSGYHHGGHKGKHKHYNKKKHHGGHHHTPLARAVPHHQYDNNHRYRY